MGQIEEIFAGIHPIKEFFNESKIFCHVLNNSVDIVFLRPDKGFWGLYIHTGQDDFPEIFFLLPPIFPFIKDGQRRNERHEWIAFEASDIFQYLGIEYSLPSGGFIPVLSSLSRMISSNIIRIFDCSTKENIQRTYSDLMAMRQDNRISVLFHVPTMSIVRTYEEPFS